MKKLRLKGNLPPDIPLVSGAYNWNINEIFSTYKYPINSVIHFRLCMQNAEVSIHIWKAWLFKKVVFTIIFKWHARTTEAWLYSYKYVYLIPFRSIKWQPLFLLTFHYTMLWHYHGICNTWMHLFYYVTYGVRRTFHTIGDLLESRNHDLVTNVNTILR